LEGAVLVGGDGHCAGREWALWRPDSPPVFRHRLELGADCRGGGPGAGRVLAALPVAARATLTFLITTRTIDVESGLLSKNIETLQLWRVRDTEFHQTMTDRLLGVSRIRVFSHDVTTPQLLLWDCPVRARSSSSSRTRWRSRAGPAT